MDCTIPTQEPLTDSEATPEDLKKVLEWELTLDNNDLRSHAWYHGTIPRQRAEELMSEEGDFLIRDCISRPGDYVLTCKWNTTWLHFVINKVVFQPFTVYEKIQYQFEDDCFDTVPDLVTYYVGNKRAISAASGAIVSKPVNRSMPLSYYATRYGLECQIHYATIALEKAAGTSESPSSKKSIKDEANQSRSSQLSDVAISTDANNAAIREGSSTLPRPSNTIDCSHRNNNVLTQSHQNNSSALPSKLPVVRIINQSTDINPTTETIDLTNSESSRPKDTGTDHDADGNSPPPKPSRIPSTYQGTKSYSTYQKPPTSSGKEINSSHLYSEPNYPDKASEMSKFDIDSTTNPVHEDGKQSTNKRCSPAATIPDLYPPSNYEVEKFTTLLLPQENKPLDPQALARMRCMLLEFGPRVIASHLTQTDVDILKVAGQRDLGLGVITGYELILLPQGHQMRIDLLERTECLKYFVAITVLTCGDEEVRSQILNKWIQVAIETKTALGNLYGFTGIMQGLSLPQISRLRSTWLKLRQTCTENAFTYETKLRPTMKNMQECSNPQAPNTCVPYLMSTLLILQRHFEILNGIGDSLYVEDEKPQTPQESSTILSTKEKGKVLKLGLQWELTSSDYGIQLLLAHLEIARSVNHQWQTYRRNSEIVLENAKYDDLMLDMFRTEFQLRFLWGLKGSHVSPKERYSKLQQVLNVMSERCEAT